MSQLPIQMSRTTNIRVQQMMDRWTVPAVLANTSLCAEPSEMMAAAAAAAVASPVGVRSKVKVPEVVNCPDGDTVTVGGRTC